ncbi:MULTISPECIES: flagellar hook-length control protein FliK [unclassified Stenotrophomonas]|uniref:flagellar hook-length control protein FliK n=1 Tax=unclassified Stenotrophomonas TaxID=196198 RepID=UPI000D16A092|nr:MULTISPECIES: flagellar hook-length control protein FliK [unclassified Stenotrophomonas]PTA72646.1 flagellar hook-length control protein FliK [Stenotrophomonas sp. Nf1]PTA75896.1 flagellar hook-length control protein FliK [Stenotrophomonas sp. Nf4]
MPTALSGSASASTSATGTAAGRGPRNESSKDFSQLLQGGPAPSAPATASDTPSAPSTSASGQPATSDGNGRTRNERTAEPDAAGSEPATAPPLPPGTAEPSIDKDKALPSDDAPWPPLGLAGLVLAVAVPVDPAAALPAATAAVASSAGALPDTAVPATTPALPTAAAAGAPASATASTTAAPTADDAGALPLPELILPGSKRGEQGDGSDLTAIGDRAAPPLLHAPAPAALQELKAALATGTAIFNGEPTPKPVLGDDGFDQAIGTRLGWLADQKIGHAHIRLSPDDMGPVDVRLQLNGDKVHASFSSPHVDVRQALESSLPRLRELLGEQGFQLAHADVGHQSPGGDGQAAGQTGSGGIVGDGEPSPGDAGMSSAQMIRQRGLLDAYA